MITLNDFVVHKKLYIGNIKIEPRKVTAEYRIVRKNNTTINYLFDYSYEKNYFDKSDSDDVNLASIMLAQVAINYGLFFEEMEFDGLYDDNDKKFIIEMIENTSVEIYINKLLIDNPFLVKPFDSLTFEKKEKYTASKIIFTNYKFANLKLEKLKSKTDINRYAILSSGGKESLLSYGLLQELGTPYPVFVNESGRHWYTAYNSYHYFKDNINNTEKPWTNSDRVFNWFLKNLPFIKKNYADMSADIYPIRLWTVAIFLFAVLPVARKNNIGNIIIGDEYDTTVRGIYKGLNHYLGLYDQSRYFDNYLSKYYKRKGWEIRQYSLLRSLSEMLGLKILVKRYPDLQRYQVSCHAAHSKNGKMYPCGKCEKCRRIIGMLIALDEDPKRCGYTDEQIKHAFTTLSKYPTHQIETDRNHLYYLLINKDLIEPNNFTKKQAKAHPEIFKLRFGNKKSIINEIPEHIRPKLLEIYLHYADGIVSMKNGKWEEIENINEFIKG